MMLGHPNSPTIHQVHASMSVLLLVLLQLLLMLE